MAIEFKHTQEEYINFFDDMGIAEHEDHIKVMLLVDEIFDLQNKIAILLIEDNRNLI